MDMDFWNERPQPRAEPRRKGAGIKPQPTKQESPLQSGFCILSKIISSTGPILGPQILLLGSHSFSTEHPSS